MAVWQFRIELIPSNWFIENTNGIEMLYTDGSYDSEPAWSGILFNSIELTLIDKFYSRYAGWHKNHICWGNEESTDIQLWKNGSYVESMSARIDARGNINFDILSIIAIAEGFGCHLFLPELKIIIEPIEHEIRNNIIKSRAAAFTKDPVGFLKKLT